MKFWVKLILFFVSFLLLSALIFYVIMYQFDSSPLSENNQNLIGLGDGLVGLISGIISLVIFLLGNFVKTIKDRKAYENKIVELSTELDPFYRDARVDRAIENFVPTQYQAQAPVYSSEHPNEIITDPNRKPLIDYLLKDFKIKDQTEHKFLILGNAGMGKTTFMINFISKLYREKIDRPIKIIDLGDPGANEELELFLAQEPEILSKSVLLLDAYDEYTEVAFDINKLEKALIDILDNIWRVKHLVITCRINFFPNEFLEKGKFIEKEQKTLFKLKGEKRMHQLTALYVSPFSEKEIQQYLNKKYGWYNYFKIKAAKEIVLNSHDLMSRPLLLSYIDDLMGKEYEYTFQRYEMIIEKWIEREADKPRIDHAFSEVGDFKSQLYTFTEDIALNMYRHEAERKGFFIPIEEIETQEFWKRLQLIFKSDKRKLSKREATLKGLLVHDTVKNRLRFAHRSILEYFVAKAVIDEKITFEEFDVVRLTAGSRFLIEMLFEDKLGYSSEAFAELYPKNTFVKLVENNLQKLVLFKNIRHENLAQTFYNLGNYIGRIRRKINQGLVLNCYKKAIELKSDFGDAYYCLANQYYELKEYDLAINNYSRAITFNTTKKDIYGDLGSCYLAIGDLVNAEIILSTGFKIDAKNDRTLVVLGFYSLIKKDTEEAKKMWQKSNSHAMKKEFVFSYMLGCYVIYNLAQYNITEEDFQKIIDELQK